MLRRKECCARGDGQLPDKLTGDEPRHLHPCIAALCNRERVDNHSTSAHCVIGFLLLLQHRHTGSWCTRSIICTSAAVAALLQLCCSSCSCVAASAHRQLVESLNNISRSPASKEADTGGGRNGHDARQSFADLQAAVPASLFADAAGDARHAASTCSHKHVFSCSATPGTTVCLGGG